MADSLKTWAASSPFLSIRVDGFLGATELSDSATNQTPSSIRNIHARPRRAAHLSRYPPIPVTPAYRMVGVMSMGYSSRLDISHPSSYSSVCGASWGSRVAIVCLLKEEL